MTDLNNTISVIIPSYNAANNLPDLINALNNQSVQATEIVVVVDGSSDNSNEVLAKLASQNRNLKVVCQENLGRAVSRNNGAKAAESKYLLFLDSDMIPDPDLVGKHLSFQAKNTSQILAGNQLEPQKELHHDFLVFKADRRLRWNQEYKTGLNYLKTENIFLTAANFSISKSTFHKLDGFDERLTDAEDFDFAMRAMERGIPVVFNPQAIAWHMDTSLAKDTIRRMRQYRIAHQKLEKLKPELTHKYQKYRLRPVKGLKWLFFRMMASPVLVNLIDEEKLSLLPQSIRFRIYDYTLAALGNYFREVPLYEIRN